MSPDAFAAYHPAAPVRLLATLVWQDVSTLLVVLGTVAAIPVGVMTFYLRSIREQQLSNHADVHRRVDHLESGLRSVGRRAGEHERDFVTKEDWLRESMLARHGIERLTEAFARLDAELRAGGGSADGGRETGRRWVDNESRTMDQERR